MGTFLGPLLSSGGQNTSIVNSRTGEVVVSSVETAFDSQSRNRGLLGRPRLADSVGLVLAPCNTVHTFFMQFPIDVVFVDRAGVVRRIACGVHPWRIRVALFRGHSVLETSAGVIQRSGTRAGDRLIAVTASPAPVSYA